jgi:hypothetical protein
MARAEAEEAEREDDAPEEPEAPEPDDDDDDDEEPEAVAPELPTFDPAELEKEQRRHERALDKVFGGLDAFDGCEHCGGLGMIPKGLEAAPEPMPHPEYHRCAACNGYGEMATGSLRDGFQTRPCSTCNGNGYIDRVAQDAADRARALLEQPPAAPPPPAPVWDASRGAWVDHFGQPLGVPAQSAGTGYAA